MEFSGREESRFSEAAVRTGRDARQGTVSFHRAFSELADWPRGMRILSNIHVYLYVLSFHLYLLVFVHQKSSSMRIDQPREERKTTKIGMDHEDASFATGPWRSYCFYAIVDSGKGIRDSLLRSERFRDDEAGFLRILSFPVEEQYNCRSSSHFRPRLPGCSGLADLPQRQFRPWWYAG